MDTNSEEWRAECEAQYIAKLGYSKRVEWMLALAEKRGKEAAEKIEKRVLEILTSGSTKELL